MPCPLRIDVCSAEARVPEEQRSRRVSASQGGVHPETLDAADTIFAGARLDGFLIFPYLQLVVAVS